MFLQIQYSSLLINGILLGVSLSFMVGPLLFGLLETSLTRGARAGLAVAIGMWASDVFYIALVIFGLHSLEAAVAMPGFKFYAGLFGGAMLCAFGAGSLFSKQKNVERENEAVAAKTEKMLNLLDGPEAPGQAPNWMSWGLAGFWLKGFILNTFNPGTIFFWLGISTAVVVPGRWGMGQTTVFFGGMMLTLMLTDSLKVYAARKVRRFLTPGHILQMRRGIGLVLLALGLFFIARAI